MLIRPRTTANFSLPSRLGALGYSDYQSRLISFDKCVVCPLSKMPNMPCLRMSCAAAARHFSDIPAVDNNFSIYPKWSSLGLPSTLNLSRASAVHMSTPGSPARTKSHSPPAQHSTSYYCLLSVTNVSKTKTPTTQDVDLLQISFPGNNANCLRQPLS